MKSATAAGRKIAGTRAVSLNVVTHLRVKRPARLRQAPFAALVKYVYLKHVLSTLDIYIYITLQGPCCTAECNLRFGDKCRDDNGCRDASFCDGRSAYCPPSINKPNKTICNREFVCFMGVSISRQMLVFFLFHIILFLFPFFCKECTGSICLAYGLESCQCIPGPNDPPTKACELCCRLPGENQPCLYVINYLSSCIYIYVFFFIAIKINVSMIDVARRSSFDWNSPPYDIPDMFSKPGTPCNDYNGYCDVFQKCREVSNICYLLL